MHLRSSIPMLPQMEWMDHTSNTILWPPSQLSNHLYCMGYCRSSICHSYRWNNFPPVWQEMVGILWPCLSFSLNIVHPRTLRRGKHRLILWPDREADGAMESTTPSKMSTRDEMGRLEKVIYDTEPSIFSSLSEQSYVIARQKIWTWWSTQARLARYDGF